MNDSRIKYSVPLRSIWEMYREWTRKNNQDGDAFYSNTYQYAMSQSDPKIQQAQILHLNFWHADYQGKFLHVWFEQKELYDFLQNDVELKDLYSIKHYLATNGNHLKEKDPYDSSIEYSFVRHDIALHVPNLADGYAFSFCLMPDDTIAIFFVSDDGVGQIHEKQYNIVKSRSDAESLSVERNFRFAVNLLAYMECFPECVREGIPSSSNDVIYQTKGRNVRISVSEKVIEEDEQKSVKRPHMRKGYFKCLSSSFYKHKRGQIIFVRETMVNGKSKTVDMSDDESKIDEFKHT